MAAKKKPGKAVKAGSKSAGKKSPAKKSPARKSPPSAKSAAKKSPAKKSAKKAPAKRSAALNLSSAAPGFTANDLQKSLAWYTDVLGFHVSERWEFNGTLQGVELKAGNVTFMIGQDDWKKGRDRSKGEGVRIYCETSQDIDALAAAIKSRGGALTQEPKDQSWGMRDIAMDDPDGYKITIAANIRKKKR
jgi:uncharacterized glyoxalase superfamily protein PhnB